MTSKELEDALKGFADEMKKSRHNNNDHISEVIGEIRLEHKDMKDAIIEIQKNGATLTAICNNVEKALNVFTQDLNKRCEEHEKEHRRFIKEVYELPSVKYQTVNSKRLDDLEKVAEKLSESNEKQNQLLIKHEKWFFAGWVLFVATQIVLKYLPSFLDK